MRRRVTAVQGSSYVELLVSVQLVALAMTLVWPLYRLVASVAEGNGSTGSSIRLRAARYVQAELEYLRSLDYARFRDPATCDVAGPPPFPPVRVLPADLEPGEPSPPAPLGRAEVRVREEPVLGPVPDGCGPRWVWVAVYGPGGDQPLAQGGMLRVRH